MGIVVRERFVFNRFSPIREALDAVSLFVTANIKPDKQYFRPVAKSRPKVGIGGKFLSLNCIVPDFAC